MSADVTAIVTDIHLEPDHEAELLDAFEETLEQITEYGSSDLVILGDVVQESRPSTDRRLFEGALDRIREAGLSFRCVPGNHDALALDPSVYADIVGHKRWAIDGGRDRAYLDSTAPDLPLECARVSDPQLEELRKAVPTMSDGVVFVHHPVHYRDLRDNYWFSDHPEEAFCHNKRTVNETWAGEQDRLAATINGHLHEWGHARYNGIDHFSIDAFNKHREPDGETGAFAVLKEGDGFKLRHVAGDGTEHTVQLGE